MVRGTAPVANTFWHTSSSEYASDDNLWSFRIFTAQTCLYTQLYKYIYNCTFRVERPHTTKLCVGCLGHDPGPLPLDPPVNQWRHCWSLGFEFDSYIYTSRSYMLPNHYWSFWLVSRQDDWVTVWCQLLWRKFTAKFSSQLHVMMEW